MWSWLSYPLTPAMPRGALPVISRLALSKADGLHAWESVFRFGVDCGRTEGATIASAFWITFILFVAVTALSVIVLNRLLRK